MVGCNPIEILNETVFRESYSFIIDYIGYSLLNTVLFAGLDDF